MHVKCYMLYMSYMTFMSFMTYMRIWHLSFGMHIYFNMVVKRSVRTSGMQQTCLDILQNCFEGQKLKYSVSWFCCRPMIFLVAFIMGLACKLNSKLKSGIFNDPSKYLLRARLGGISFFFCNPSSVDGKKQNLERYQYYTNFFKGKHFFLFNLWQLIYCRRHMNTITCS